MTHDAPQPVGPRPRRHRRLNLALAVALAVLLAVGGWNWYQRWSHFTLTGTLTLTKGVESVDSVCFGTDGYDDINTGTAVTVYDADGTVVATGSLTHSELDEYGGGCRFDMQAENVPRGEDFYQVEIAHRGKVTVDAEDAEQGKFAAQLGD